MTWNDYMMKAWDMLASSSPVSAIANKTYKGPQFQQKPTVVYEKPKGQPYGGLYHNGLIKVVTGPQQQETLNHEMAHDKYRNMYNSLEPLGSDARNWQPLMGIEGFDKKVKQYDPKAFNLIDERLQNPLYKNYIDIPNEFYAYYSNMPKVPDLRKYY